MVDFDKTLLDDVQAVRDFLGAYDGPPVGSPEWNALPPERQEEFLSELSLAGLPVGGLKFTNFLGKSLGSRQVAQAAAGKDPKKIIDVIVSPTGDKWVKYETNSKVFSLLRKPITKFLGFSIASIPFQAVYYNNPTGDASQMASIKKGDFQNAGNIEGERLASELVQEAERRGNRPFIPFYSVISNEIFKFTTAAKLDRAERQFQAETDTLPTERESFAKASLIESDRKTPLTPEEEQEQQLQQSTINRERAKVESGEFVEVDGQLQSVKGKIPGGIPTTQLTPAQQERNKERQRRADLQRNIAQETRAGQEVRRGTQRGQTFEARGEPTRSVPSKLKGGRLL